VSFTNQRDSKNSKTDANSHKNNSQQRTDSLASSSSKKETPTSPVTVIVYENTKASNNMFLKASDKPKQLSMPNLNDSSKFSLGKRQNSQKQTKSVRVDSDYETAFPIFNKISGHEASNVVDKDGSVNPTEKQDTETLHMVKLVNGGETLERSESTRSYTEVSDSEKKKSEVKPKPKVRRHVNKVHTEMGNEQDPKQYKHFSAKMKRDTFKQANLLNTVPPPCNKNTYVNVPDTSNDSTSNKSLQEESMKHSDSFKKTNNSVSRENENLECGANDYVNVPEKKCINSAFKKSLNGETAESLDIPGTANVTPVEMLDDESYQYENVPDKKSTISESDKPNSGKSNECINELENKSTISKPEKTNCNESKDYVNMPNKKSITSVTKSNTSGKTHERFSKTKVVNKEVNEYVNIPDNISINVVAEDSWRNSCDYEDPGCFMNLKKDTSPKDEKALAEKHDHTIKQKSRYLKNVPNLKIQVPNSKTDKSYQDKTETRRGFRGLDTVRFTANTSVTSRGRSISEATTDNKLDYENENAMIELKLSKKRLLRRGLSTSSLETSGRLVDWRAEKVKTKPLAPSRDGNVSDDETYLEMNNVQKDEDLYLQMNSPKDSIYVRMTSPEEDEEYMPMASMKSNHRNTLQPVKNEDIGFAVRTCPKPCGGARSGVYDNFSEQPTNYANFFRSKSTNNVNEYSYADTKPVVKFN
jgi:hypothetical protein